MNNNPKNKSLINILTEGQCETVSDVFGKLTTLIGLLAIVLPVLFVVMGVGFVSAPMTTFVLTFLFCSIYCVYLFISGIRDIMRVLK